MRSDPITIALVASLATLGTAARAEEPVPLKPLTVERISLGQPPLVVPGMTSPTWRDARRFTYLAMEGGERALFEYDTKTGSRTKLLSPPTPADGPGEEGERKPALPLSSAAFSPDGTVILIPGEGDLYLHDPARKKTRRLTRDTAEEEYPTFSPDGKRVAYVKKSDLHVVEITTGKETRLTTTGTDHVFNGKLDWVYEEELANRKSGRSYEWSPDGTALVYLRLDENRVPEYPIVDYMPTNGRLLSQRYPKAGDPNAIPSVHVVDVTGKETASVTFSPDDLYVAPELSWTKDSSAACFLVLNREQTELDVNLLPRGAGANAKPTRLLREKDPAWVNSLEPPRFLSDGSFLFLSERTGGFLHVYRHARDGSVRNAVTQGPWLVADDLEVDEKGGFVYFTATEKDPRERHVYRAKLDGTGFTRLSSGRGTHTFDLSPDGSHYLHTFSDIDSPPRIALVASSGERVALVDEPRNELSRFSIGTTEMLSFKGRDGTEFFAKLVKPADFDPARKYPVVVFIYGGPHSQVVADRWRATAAIEHVLASKGMLVWSMDNRGAAGRGHAFEAPLLRKMGETELADQLEGVAHLKSLPYVDGSRLGIYGWSYGGYMTLYATTHSDVFKAALAGAPVTDWKLYDSIYTERYMKLPKDNAAGYTASAPLSAVARLQTKLLLVHGTADDNVHLQNSIQLVDALVKARKDFSFVPLPGQKHSVRDPAASLYLNQLIVDFFEKNL